MGGNAQRRSARQLDNENSLEDRIMFDSSKYKNDYNFHNDRENFFDRESRIQIDLRSDLEDEFNTTDHPKAEELWQKSWEAYRYGPYDVYSMYEELLELVS